MRVVAVGRFDGVHRGHQHLLARARELARELGASTCAYTFPPQPGALLPLPAKRRLLLGLCDEVVVRPWEEVRHLSPEDFVESELKGKLAAVGVVLGSNHRFGRDAAGDAGLLKELGRRLDLVVRVVEPLEEGGEPISSRRIRALVREGRVEEAAGLLGRPHLTVGDRVRGAGLAGRLGFPTVNLRPWPGLVEPRAGVYAAWAHWRGGGGAGLFYHGARGTFPELPPSTELHLFSPPRPEPEGPVEVWLASFLRPDRTFPSERELVAAIREDVARAERALAGSPPPPPLVVAEENPN